jgi:hypothetical protein
MELYLATKTNKSVRAVYSQELDSLCTIVISFLLCACCQALGWRRTKRRARGDGRKVGEMIGPSQDSISKARRVH